MLRATPLVLLCCALAASSLQGQAGPATGSRVRALAPSVSTERLVGTVAAATMDSLLLSVAGGGAVLRLDKAAIESMQVSRGPSRLRWAVLGTGVGMLGGMIIGGAMGSHEDPNGFGGLVGMIGGAVVGAPVGAVAGALLAPDRWVDYPLPRSPE